MLRIEGLTKKYKQKIVLDNISLDFSEIGASYAIIGKSGSGKTTLLNILFGLDSDFEGTYYLFEKKSHEYSIEEWDMIRKNHLQIVFQNFNLLPAMTVYENLYYSAWLSEEEDVDVRIREVLRKVDLEDRLKEKVGNLSGGEKQRIALARATLNHPRVLLLDEPTGNLDEENVDRVLEYLDRIREEGTTIILITHDKRVSEKMDYVYRIEAGAVQRMDGRTFIHSHGDNTAVESTNPKSESRKKASLRQLVQYAFASVKTKSKELFFNHIAVLLIFMSFLIVYNIFQSSSVASFNQLFKGLTEDVIILDLNQVAEGETESDQFGFTEGEIARVASLPGVKEVVPFSGATRALYDNDKFIFNSTLEREAFPEELQESPSYSSSNTPIQFSFMSSTVPYAYKDSYNKDQLNLLAGTLPHDRTDEILIPDILAFDFRERLGLSITQDLVGKEILLDVVDFKGNPTTESYTISGIYQTTYQNQIPEMVRVYVNYIDIVKETYGENDMQTTYEQIKKDSALSSGIAVDSFQEFQKKFGTGYSELLIITESEERLSEVTAQIQEMFPSLLQLSQYSIKSGEFSKIYKRLMTMLIGGTLLLAIILGVIVTFLNKGYIHSRNKELAILYSLGYSKKNTAFVLLLENLIVFGTDAVVAYAILGLTYRYYLQFSRSYAYFTNMFSLGNILYSLLLLLVIMSVATLWGIRGINKKKLKNYLFN